MAMAMDLALAMTKKYAPSPLVKHPEFIPEYLENACRTHGVEFTINVYKNEDAVKVWLDEMCLLYDEKSRLI